MRAPLLVACLRVGGEFDRYEGHDEQDDKHPEQKPCRFHGEARDAAEADSRCYERNN